MWSGLWCDHVQKWRTEVAKEQKHCAETLVIQTSRHVYEPTLVESTLAN